MRFKAILGAMPGLLFRERVRPDISVEGIIRDANPERVSIANSQALHGWCETKAGSLEGKYPLLPTYKIFHTPIHQLSNQRNFRAIGKSLQKPEHHTFVPSRLCHTH